MEGKIIRTLAVSYPTPHDLTERSTKNLDFGGMLSLINDFATFSMLDRDVCWGIVGLV